MKKKKYILYKNKLPGGKTKSLKIYKQLNENDCWRTSVANILQIAPRKVPHFVKKYKNRYIKKTREWLNTKYNKGLIYVPLNQFLETGSYKYNTNMYPQGKSIVIAYRDETCTDTHAFLCIDGELVENFDGQYENIIGYFVIHDLL